MAAKQQTHNKCILLQKEKVNYMKKKILLILMSLIIGISQVGAHSGRLDSNGGHYNRKTGKYYKHRGDSNVGTIILIVLGGLLLYGMFKSKDK